MNYPKWIILYIAFINNVNIPFAQTDPSKLVATEIQKIEANFYRIDALSYHAQMFFKDMGSQNYDERHFEISYRKNEGNPLYGYDWTVSEKSIEGTLNILAIPEGIYFILDYQGEKSMSWLPLPKQIEIGNYIETMRVYFMMEQVLNPFIMALPNSISLKDSADHVVLIRDIDTHWTKEIIVNKESLLPTIAIEIDDQYELDLQQIKKTVFSNYQSISSDSIFSADYYRNHGYKDVVPSPSDKPEDPEPDLEKVKESILTYPFVYETGDTLYLKNNESKYVLLDFWYASCEPCLKGLPIINSLSNSFPEEKLRVIGINCFDEKSKSFVSSKLRAKGINMELLFGNRSLIDDVNMRAFPTYILLKDNQTLSLLNGDANDVVETIHQLLK